MAKGRRKRKPLVGAATATRSRKSSTDSIKLGGGRTQFKQKAFGGKEITKVFKESNVLRDAAGKFIDKPGQGEPPKYKALDQTKKRIEAAKRSNGDVNSPRYKQMDSVLKRVKKRQKANQKLEEARKEITSQERARDVQEMKDSIRDLIDLRKQRVLTKDLVDQEIKVELSQVLSKYTQKRDREQVLRDLGVEPRQLGIETDSTTVRTIKPLTVASTPEQIRREIAEQIGMSESQIRRLEDRESQEDDIQKTAEKIRNDLQKKLRELYPVTEEPQVAPSKPSKGYDLVEYDQNTIKKAKKITEKSQKATKSTLKSQESIAKRFQELESLSYTLKAKKV